MPSAFGAEQIAAPSGADVAFVLDAMGPDGPTLIQHADFSAADEMGRPSRSARLVQGGRRRAGDAAGDAGPPKPTTAVRAHR